MIEAVVIRTLVNGSVYALLASGLTLLFGVGRMINLAHTAFFMLVGYGMYYLMRELGWGAAESIAVVLVGITLLGLLTYRFLINRVRQHAQAVLLITIALAMAFQESMLLAFGSYYRSAPRLIPGSTEILGITVLNQYLLIIGTVVAILVALSLLLTKTKLGTAIRATANDAEVANLMGISVPRTLMITMGIATALAGVAGVLVAPLWTISPLMWLPPLTMVLVIVILGGLGSVKGSIIGAYIIALVEISVIRSPLSTHLVTPLALLVLVIILIVRPGGLFGIVLEEERL